MLDISGHLAVAGSLTIDIDLASKTMLRSKLDDRELSPEDSIILVWFHTISAGHVKLHALANWAVNDLTKGFVRQNSIVTVMHNYFGCDVFPRLAGLWHRCG